MKIGVDIRVLMDKNYSGVSEYTANLLTAILKADTTDDFKLFYNSWDNLDARLAPWERANAKVIGRHIPNKIFNYFCQKIFARPKIDEALGGVDIFWSPHFNFSALSLSVKKIITVHDLSFLRYPEFFSARKNFWHRALGVKNILRSADKIIAVSENTKNDIIELVGLAPEKIKVIYSGNNAVKREPETKELEAYLRAHGLSSGFILYLGTIEPRKNIGGLISAYEKLRAENNEFKDIKLVLAGANGWKNKKIYAQAKRSVYQSDIVFLGYVSQTEKDILYSRAGVFVYPSFYEGFGFPPLEAMTYGVPVICSNVSSLPEVVGDAALLINPFRADEISEALKLILSDAALRKLLVERADERIKLFTWEKTAAEYLKIFHEI
ncbi:MAG: glycosyltransferase family 1 protein [Patescibacteria group bacterium]